MLVGGASESLRARLSLLARAAAWDLPPPNPAPTDCAACAGPPRMFKAGSPAAMSTVLHPKACSSLLDLSWTAVLVGVWYFSNFQFGFGLKRTSKRFQNPELCVFLLWVLFTVGWAVAAAVRLVYKQLVTRRADGAASPRKAADDLADSQRQACDDEAAVAGNHLMTVVAHTLGMSFTCLAFIAGSVPVVQVIKAFCLSLAGCHDGLNLM